MIKGITPIISIILLLMMTVATSVAAYFWMTGIQADIQENVQRDLESSFITELTSFTIVSTICNASSDNITVVLLNTGSVSVSSGDLIAVLSSSAGSTLDTIIDNNFPGLGVSESIVLEYTSGYDIQPSTLYAVRVTVPGGVGMSDSCSAS